MALWLTTAWFEVLLFGLVVAFARSTEVTTKMIGYFDAKSQLTHHFDKIPHGNLTHVVLAHALTVDEKGKLHILPRKAKYGNVSGDEFITHLAKQPSKLIVGLRGFPDDVSFDTLAENVGRRERFVNDIVTELVDWGASGLEIEWHADDVAGDKPKNSAFDAFERDHIALLMKGLSDELHPRGLTLSMAVRPGRQEFTSGVFVQKYIDWLAVRAFSMRSLGDPHHSSLKDMAVALGEWTLQGVPPEKLVLSTGLFARPGAALRSNKRDHALRTPWRDIVGEGGPTAAKYTPAVTGNMRGDVFVDSDSGKAWWMSGLDTTTAKLQEVLDGGYGGLAFRDLHHDAQNPNLSIVRTASEALTKHRKDAADALKVKLEVARPLSLFQRGNRLQRSSDTPQKHEEF